MYSRNLMFGYFHRDGLLFSAQDGHLFGSLNKTAGHFVAKVSEQVSPQFQRKILSDINYSATSSATQQLHPKPSLFIHASMTHPFPPLSPP